MQYQIFRLNSNFVVVAIAVVLVVVSGCGGSAVKHARKQAKQMYEIQKPIVVDTTRENKQKRPEWTFKSMDEDEENVYFSGSFMNGSDYPLSVRCANAEALKVATQSIGQFIRTEFSEYVEGSNQAGYEVNRFVEDGIAVLTKNLHMQGLRQTEIYYEEIFSPAVMQPAWNVWVRLQMLKADYLHAKAEALRQLRDRFESQGQKQAKEKAESLLESLKNEVI